MADFVGRSGHRRQPRAGGRRWHSSQGPAEHFATESTVGASEEGMAKTLAFSLLLMAPLMASANDDTPARLSPGDKFPPLRGEFLTGRDAQLPDVAVGKVALVMLGFTYDSRYAVEAWGEWYREAIGLGDDTTFFEVPMIGGMGRLGRWFIDRGMQRGTPKELHENVITVYGGTGDWKRRVGFAAEDAAYLILLDRDGVVRWMHAGDFDQAKATELEAAIAALR
jgi:hypothetical protein